MSATGKPTWPATVRLPRRTPGTWPQRTGLALKARLHAETLDRALAERATSREDTLLATRAAQLTGARHRAQLAGGLARIRREALEDPELRSLAAVVVPDLLEARRAEAELIALERRLRDARPAHPAAVARLGLLLTDAEGPLYAPVGAGSIGRHLRELIEELDG
jgi:siderophore synthetase component